MKIVTIGGATQDIFMDAANVQTVAFHHDTRIESFLLFQEGSKVEIENLVYSTGGGAANSAISFKRLEFNVSSFFKIADDCPGEFILSALKAHNIQIEHAIKSQTGNTGISYIIPSPNCDSTILTYRGTNGTISQEEFPIKLLESRVPVYITSLSGESSKLLPHICKQAKELNCLVATNPGNSQLISGAHDLRAALKYIDIFILNGQEAQRFMRSLIDQDDSLKHFMSDQQPEEPTSPKLLSNLLTYQDTCFNITHYFKEVAKHGPKIIVVTNGDEGVYVYNDATIYYHPSLTTHVANTLGAGDSFGSCFVASILKGYSLEQAMIYGIINSSSVISHINAKDGLLDWNQLQKRAATVGISGMQIFKI